MQVTGFGTPDFNKLLALVTGSATGVDASAGNATASATGNAAATSAASGKKHHRVGKNN